MHKGRIANTIHQAVIRTARVSDASQIGPLLHELGYPVSADFVHQQLSALLNDPNEDLLVAEADDSRVIAFLAMHYVPQIAVEGGFARISYLCVDKEMQLRGLGKMLEREALLGRVRRAGIPVVAWRGPGTLDEVLRRLGRRSARTTAGRS